VEFAIENKYFEADMPLPIMHTNWQWIGLAK